MPGPQQGQKVGVVRRGHPVALLGDNPEGWLCPQAPQCSKEEPWVPGHGRTLRERGVQSSHIPSPTGSRSPHILGEQGKE